MCWDRGEGRLARLGLLPVPELGVFVADPGSRETREGAKVKIHNLSSGTVIELRVFIDSDQFIRLQRWRERLNRDQHGDDVNDEQAASLALVGALLRMEVFKDPV